MTTPEAGAPADGTSTTPPPTGGNTPDGGSVNQVSASLARRIGQSSATVVVLAFVIALLVGSVLIIIVNAEVQETVGYFFARPGDFFQAAGAAVADAYISMFQGAVYNSGADTFALRIRPLTETFTVATPLITASIGMAVAFRAGLFNIGGTGQLIMGAIAAGFVGFHFSMPPVVHLIVALLAGIVAGGIWGGLAGALKARFEANEVISTIMLNWIATYLIAFLLTTTLFTGRNSSQPLSPSVKETAQLPLLLGSQFRLNAGLIVALLVVVFLWWLLNRSSIGFKFRAVGENPNAAQTAGISVGWSSFGVMMVAGAIVGLAGALQVLGTERRLSAGIAGNVGFDAITVALLGASGPVGILLAGILFAGLSVGGALMESAQGVPKEVVQVIQSVVVLFIAAPPLVRTIFGLRAAERRRRRKESAERVSARVSADGGERDTGHAAEEPAEESAGHSTEENAGKNGADR